MISKISDGFLTFLICVLLPVSGIVGFKMVQDLLHPVEIVEVQSVRN